MLIVTCLNGYSSSSREPGEVLGTVIRDELDRRELDYLMFEAKSRLVHSNARKARQFMRRHAAPDNVLLVAGKSLGARNIVRFGLNVVGALSYRHILLLTVDPCWPTWTNLMPNLSHERLHLTRWVTQAINLRVVPETPDQQCGAQLVGTRVENRLVAGTTHQHIVANPVARLALSELLRYTSHDEADTSQ